MRAWARWAARRNSMMLPSYSGGGVCWVAGAAERALALCALGYGRYRRLAPEVILKARSGRGRPGSTTCDQFEDPARVKPEYQLSNDVGIRTQLHDSPLKISTCRSVSHRIARGIRALGLRIRCILLIAIHQLSLDANKNNHSCALPVFVECISPRRNQAGPFSITSTAAQPPHPCRW